MKTTVPLLIAFVVGFVMVISFFAPPGENWLQQLAAELLVWGTIIGGFTFLLGTISTIRVNWKQVTMRKEGWQFNVVTVIAVFVMALPALWPRSWAPEAILPLLGRNEGSIYAWFFDHVTTPMSQTMFAMLAFYIATAAYRAFRARSTQSTLLLLTAALVMFWRVPMGEAALNWISHFLPDGMNLSSLVNTYIINGVNLSVQRGIIIGAAMGAATMALRVLLGIERSYLGKS